MFIFLVFSGLVTTSQASNEIKIIRVSDYQQDQMLFLDSESRFNLPQAVIKAINHEIPLTFKTEIILSEKNQWMGLNFERTRTTIKYSTRLSMEGVNRHYVLYNSRNHKEQSFSTLASALQALATLQGFPIIALSKLHPKQHYTLKMRISLDYWKLPSPMLIESLFESHWKLDSNWYEVGIQTPVSWL